MHYTFETSYNQTSLSIMAKCIRKTVRKKRSRRSHIFGWLVVLLALLLSFSSGEGDFVIEPKTIVTWTAAGVMVFTLIFEDSINGYFAGKRLLKGTEHAISVFDSDMADGFVSETSIGKSIFSYDRILLIAETQQYFVFIFSASHAQLYRKSSITGGTVDEFRAFLTEKTGIHIVSVTE